MKKILVIGSQGYLGSCLTDYLSNWGYFCKGIDTGFFRNGVIYEPKHIPFLNKDARKLVKGDLEGFDVVLFLAGISNDPFGNLTAEAIYDPTRDYALKIASYCKQLGIRFIYPSSCSVYGVGQGQLNEKGFTNPQTPYSINKVQVEQGLAEMSDDTFSPIALRLATVFGVSPRMRFDIVINMLCGLAITQNEIVLNSDGQAWRPHLHIEDVCQAFRCCIDWEYEGSELLIMNVGRNDNNWKIIDIALEIKRQLPNCEIRFLKQSDSKHDDELVGDRKIQDGVDTRTYQVNFDKIHETLPGFSAKWDIERGIEQMIELLNHWYLDKVKFKQRDFYRLQQIEFLHKSQQIDDNLYWKT